MTGCWACTRSTSCERLRGVGCSSRWAKRVRRPRPRFVGTGGGEQPAVGGIGKKGCEDADWARGADFRFSSADPSSRGVQDERSRWRRHGSRGRDADPIALAASSALLFGTARVGVEVGRGHRRPLASRHVGRERPAGRTGDDLRPTDAASASRHTPQPETAEGRSPGPCARGALTAAAVTFAWGWQAPSWAAGPSSPVVACVPGTAPTGGPPRVRRSRPRQAGSPLRRRRGAWRRERTSRRSGRDPRVQPGAS